MANDRISDLCSGISSGRAGDDLVANQAESA